MSTYKDKYIKYKKKYLTLKNGGSETVENKFQMFQILKFKEIEKKTPSFVIFKDYIKKKELSDKNNINILPNLATLDEKLNFNDNYIYDNSFFRKITFEEYKKIISKLENDPLTFDNTHFISKFFDVKNKEHFIKKIKEVNERILKKKNIDSQILPYKHIEMKTDDGKYLNKLFKEYNKLSNDKFSKLNKKISKIEKALINHRHSINTSGSTFYTPYTVFHEKKNIHEHDNKIQFSNNKFNYEIYEPPNVGITNKLDVGLIDKSKVGITDKSKVGITDKLKVGITDKL